MREYKINRPDEAAMRRILEREQTGPAGLILRLAWLQGLSRDEIAALTWDQADLEAAVLRLPDRTVPLCPEMCAFLRRLRGAQGETPRVLVSERTGGAVPPESISRLARKALDREGQTAVRLMDLRHDWIIRQLAELDWPAAARVSGVAVPALQARFAAYAPSKRPARAEEKPLVDEFQLWKVLQAERDTPAGLALWLAWQMGLQAQEIAALTWDQVDLAANALRLPDREVLLTNAVRRLLQDAWDARVPGDDPHVLLTVRSRRPVDLARLSRMTRAALIRGGMDRVLLRDLRRDEGRRGAGPDRAKVPASLPRKAPAEDRMTRADGMASGQSPLCGERLLAVPRAPGARFPRGSIQRGGRGPLLCVVAEGVGGKRRSAACGG